MTISVIVPAFNSENTIFTCIDSILHQSFRDFEIVIVNDGSTDTTDKIIQNIDDKRIHLYTISNHGPSFARNIGIEHANGEYIVFIDSDDYVDKSFLQMLLLTAEKKHDDIVSCGRYIENKGQNRVIPESLSLNTIMFFEQPGCTGILYRKSLFTDNEITFPENIDLAEDMATVPLLFTAADRCEALSVPLYHCVSIPSSITHAYTEDHCLQVYDALKVLRDSQNRFYMDPNLLEYIHLYHGVLLNSYRILSCNMDHTVFLDKIKEIEISYPNLYQNSIGKRRLSAIYKAFGFLIQHRMIHTASLLCHVNNSLKKLQ